MQSRPVPRRGVRPAVAAAVLLAGIVCAALARLVAGTEQHSYSPGAVAPASVRVTEGHLYRLAVPGGVTALTRRGVDVTTPRCSYLAGGGVARPLTVQAAGADTKATDEVGTFVAPVGGNLHVDCLGWGPLFVDDADDAAPDVSGWLLVATTVLLTVGAGLALSAARSASLGRRRPGGDEEIERLVELVHARSEDGDGNAADGVGGSRDRAPGDRPRG